MQSEIFQGSIHKPTPFELEVRARSRLRFFLGAVSRLRSWFRIQVKLHKMRKAGATIGSHIGIARNVMPPASPLLWVGDHVSIQTNQIDVRAPLEIGSYVIIGDSASIITCSHDIDAPGWTFKSYGLVIEDYVWIATRAMILPSCRRIGRGAVIGAGSVVVKDVPSMAVVSGNPARIIRYRKVVHSDLNVESLLGGGLESYLKARNAKQSQ